MNPYQGTTTVSSFLIQPHEKLKTRWANQSKTSNETNKLAQDERLKSLSSKIMTTPTSGPYIRRFENGTIIEGTMFHNNFTGPAIRTTPEGKKEPVEVCYTLKSTLPHKGGNDIYKLPPYLCINEFLRCHEYTLNGQRIVSFNSNGLTGEIVKNYEDGAQICGRYQNGFLVCPSWLKVDNTLAYFKPIILDFEKQTT